jgi:2-iminobutanoate/2-iminopropanoate deaminase
MSTTKQEISTLDAPKPVGPYSQAIESNGFLFLSGQVGIDTSGKLVGEDIESQTKQIFKNIEAILATAGLSASDIVKTTIYLTNLKDFQKVNVLYGDWVDKPFPARSTLEIAKLPLNAQIEIECIAVLN